jgi:hypothetical protein
VPGGATRAAIPPDNPQTPEKIALGLRLFFDGRLSVDGTVACSTCHDPARAFTDGRPLSIGIKGRVGQRNAPTILNALYDKTQFWDGRVKTLEEQAALGLVKGTPAGRHTASKDNKGCAVRAAALLIEGKQSWSTSSLWRAVTDDPEKTHNNQMDVVMALWRNDLIRRTL